MSPVRFVRVGRRALLAEVDDVEQAMTLYAAARAAGVEADDIVPAARTVLFEGVTDLAALEERLRSLDVSQPVPVAAGPSPVEVPVTYDGPDLDDVAVLWGMTRAEVVATHTGTDFAVAFCGFAPGFAYCTGLPAPLAVPRLDTPRARVRAGSVGLAGEFTGVYPTASPGGWRIVGHTDLVLWDAGAEPPATLAPGSAVRFVEVPR